MKTRWIPVVLVLLGSVAWLSWSTWRGRNPPPAPITLVPARHSQPATTAARPELEQAPATAPRSPRNEGPSDPDSAHVSSENLSAPVDPAHIAAVQGALEELGQLYAPAGSLGWEAAKSLIAQRNQASEALVDRLGRLGPGGARAIGASYPEARNTRAQLLLVQALGKVTDPEAGAVLKRLLDQADSLSLRKEMVFALGRRTEPGSQEILGKVLASDLDPQIRFASARSLSGRAIALPVLSERITAETSSNVRAELVRAVGLVATPQAMNVLTVVAQAPGELGLRQTAIQELARSFGPESLRVLENLLADGDEGLRYSAVKAVARVRTGQATVLLQRIAASDASFSVRTRAQTLLAGSAAGH